MSNWRKAVVDNLKPMPFFLFWFFLVPQISIWLTERLGISPFTALGLYCFITIIWVAYQLLGMQRRLQQERAALDAKYEAKMAELLQEANPPRNGLLH